MKRYDAFEGPAPVHKNPTLTEVEAKLKTEKNLKGFRKQVYDIVKTTRTIGIAGYQLAAMFPGRTESSCRTRLTELEKEYGLICKTSRYRKNFRGNQEVVWVATMFRSPQDEEAR